MSNPLHKSPSSLIGQGSTPTRHLGLSRKRKSLGGSPLGVSSGSRSPFCSPASQPHAEEPQSGREKIRKSLAQKTKAQDVESKPLTSTTDPDGGGGGGSDENRAPDDNIQIIRDRVVMKENKVKSLENSDEEMRKLENLCETWSNGCKEALLHLLNSIKAMQGESVNVKKLLRDLGIWTTMLTHFGNDSDLNLLDYDVEENET